MLSYIAVHYTVKGPAFAAVNTIEEAQAHLGQRISLQPLRLGDAVAIITADTDQVIYFRSLSRVGAFLTTFYHSWIHYKQLIMKGSIAVKTV